MVVASPGVGGVMSAPSLEITDIVEYDPCDVKIASLSEDGARSEIAPPDVSTSGFVGRVSVV